jgi:hypothetical protein
LRGPVGPVGPQGPAGIGFTKGAILEMKTGFPTPAGFTKIGTTAFTYRDLQGNNHTIILNVYQKN